MSCRKNHIKLMASRCNVKYELHMVIIFFCLERFGDTKQRRFSGV
jgi:hypothetical protein